MNKSEYFHAKLFFEQKKTPHREQNMELDYQDYCNFKKLLFQRFLLDQQQPFSRSFIPDAGVSDRGS